MLLPTLFDPSFAASDFLRYVNRKESPCTSFSLPADSSLMRPKRPYLRRVKNIPPQILVPVPSSFAEAIDLMKRPSLQAYAALGQEFMRAYRKSKSRLKACVRDGCANSFVMRSAGSAQEFCSPKCGRAHRAADAARAGSESDFVYDMTTEHLRRMDGD